jgi:hypothetical protein
VLIGNYSVLAKHPGRDIGGGAIGLGNNRRDFNKTSQSRGRYSSDSHEPKSGVPDGYRPHYCWVLPQTAGALASRNIIEGTGTFTASGAMGVNGVAALTGTGSLSATGALIVSAVAALTGTGSLSGNLQAVLNAVAALTGSGSLSGAMTAYGALTAALAGVGALSAPGYGIGNMAADISPFTVLSPESLATAVWSAIAADNNDVGTMGEKMNDAGSGSNPWTEVIEGSYTAAQLLRIIAAALAGQLAGAATTTITIKGVDETTDRIIATVDADGNRISHTLDGS